MAYASSLQLDGFDRLSSKTFMPTVMTFFHVLDANLARDTDGDVCGRIRIGGCLASMNCTYDDSFIQQWPE
eukprot:506205-Amphidinium_carterae.1